MSYATIVQQAESGTFASASISYLPPQVQTPVAATRQSLAQLVAEWPEGCRVELRRESPLWAELLGALKRETPRSADLPPGDLRWGVIFRDGAGMPQEIFGEDDGLHDSRGVYGYVNATAVQFTPDLLKTLRSLVDRLGCAGR